MSNALKSSVKNLILNDCLEISFFPWSWPWFIGDTQISPFSGGHLLDSVALMEYQRQDIVTSKDNVMEGVCVPGYKIYLSFSFVFMCLNLPKRHAFLSN
jgi:hypothetical protein